MASKDEIIGESIKLFSMLLLADESSFNNKVAECNFEDAVIINLRSIRTMNGFESRGKRQLPLNADSKLSSNIINKRIQQLEKQLAENVESCNEARESLNLNLDEIKKKTHQLEESNATLTSTVGEFNNELTSLFLSGDKHEAWSRRNILLLKGVIERDGEDTNNIAIEMFRAMGLEISPHDICRTHRNGPRLRGRHRPIYVKFVRHDVRDEVYYQRDTLRSIRDYRYVFIDENLTKYRSRLFPQACKEKLWHC